MKKSFAILIVAAAAVVGGCAAHQQGRAWWTLNEQTFTPITPTTTKDDVERLLGKPLLGTVFRNLGEEVWDYRFLNGTRVYIVEVHFDMQGRTKYYTTYPDRCQLHPIGCR
jgi:outer membrane protein assembly factor BamE (lipoprotein component of BamABCDE complex)